MNIYLFLRFAMTKDPAFLFYYQDFAYGTRKMTFAEKGAYIELLCEQADTGHLSLEDIKRTLKNDFHIWDSICSKFLVDDEGKFYNEVLEGHMEKRKKYTESRRNNLKSAKNNEKSSHMDAHMSEHMVNVNVNVNENINNTKIKKEKKDPFPEIPDSLKAIPEFPETWESFLTNRKQMEHPVTGEAAKQLFRKLQTLIDPVSELTRSIEKNWQGLFPNFDNIKPAYELSRDLHRLLIHIHQTTIALRTLKPLTPERADAFMKLYPEKIIPEKIAEIEQALMKKEITGKTMEEAIKNWRAK